MPVSMTVEEFEKWVAQAGPAMETLVIQGLREAAVYSEGQVTLAITRHKPYPLVDRGTLRQSVSSYPIPKGAELVVSAPHAKWVEYGTRPHMPPLQPLLEWVTRKGLAKGDDAIKMAEAVRWKIFMKGTKPAFFFRGTLQKIKKRNIKIVKATVKAGKQKLLASAPLGAQVAKALGGL